MTDAAAIIERLRAATGPSYELDLAIGRLVGRCQQRHDPWTAEVLDWAPPFTASLDAALTLVPEGLGRMSGKGRQHPNEPLYGCILYADNGMGEEVAQAEHEHGEAICICIAALLARQAAEAGDA